MLYRKKLRLHHYKQQCDDIVDLWDATNAIMTTDIRRKNLLRPVRYNGKVGQVESEDIEFRLGPVMCMNCNRKSNGLLQSFNVITYEHLDELGFVK